jgi:protoporphyrinogen oxidase
MSVEHRTVDTLILGAGLAGLSAAFHLGDCAEIYESESYVGGKARTETHQGFTFDVTGHWLHLRDEAIRHWILDLLGEDHFLKITRKSRVWSHGVYTQYPYQANTFGLPPHVIKSCVVGAIEADRRRSAVGPTEEPESFSDWIRYYFGDGIAEHFMLPYNAKLWGVSADQITSRWCQRFVPKPNLEDIVAGAVGCNAEGMGYNAQFLYPKIGGIQTVASAIGRAVGSDRIHLNQKATQVDPDAKTVTFDSGVTVSYQRLISTIPLPSLIDRMTGVTKEAADARGLLRANEVIYLNVGIDGALGETDHWIYVPEEKWPVYRVGSFSNANPAMAPDKCGSLYIELSDRDTPVEILRPRIEEMLVEMNLIEDAQQIRFMQTRRIPNAYVIYDFNYHDSRHTLLSYLKDVGIESIGRYGDWNYSSMEDALLDGKRMAEKTAWL